VVDEPWRRPAGRSPTADLRGDPDAPLARHVTLLVRDATGWANLCRLLTSAHAHTRPPDGGPVVDAPRVTLADLEEHAEGLVCLSGCPRSGVRDEPTMRRLLARSGATRSASSCSARSSATTAR
jgi:error-prone DNA polymerase